MKKFILLLTVVATFSSCTGTKGITDGVSKYGGTAATLISTLTPNSKLGEIAKLFTLLDTNKDKSISTTEAIGIVAEKFNVLDKDNNSGLNLSELEGLLGLLK